MTTGTAPANGIEIAYETHGDPDDEPLLLVMGLGAQLIAWPIELVDALVDRGFHVIRYDNRDVGLSTKIDGGEGGLDFMSQFLAAIAGPARARLRTCSPTWPPTASACSTTSASTPPTSSARRWAG